MSENGQTDIQALLYGLGDVKTITLPSGKTATVREMTGKEQRGFTDRNKINNGTAINELLASCVDTINDESLPNDPAARLAIVNNLLSGDRQTLLFNIRKESLGSDFHFKTKCTNCKTEGDWEVNLADDAAFPIIPYKLGDERVLEYDSKIRTGLHFRVNLIDGVAELKALKRRNTADLLTDLELRNPQAKDPASGNYIPVQLNKMGDKLIAEMRTIVREHEGSQDTKVTVFCPNCNSEVQFDLLQQPDFMIPSVIS